ncbi:LD-carboxypeptidase [Intrasporangium sp.]|uniref:S66 family peptidase n=1 Tax=Intrasporangium sp. TaxID=1925024 RepID=UPI00293A4FD0|nr:LD-carboxypeptidase [Intrasporangium sp.]MDV3223516.1 LD-carboxypeptidase [Intrasporangium sp.]
MPAQPATAIRYPAPLRPGDRIGVTAPSSGVPEALWPRVELTRRFLEDRGFEVELGACLRAPSHVSAPREQRAAELMRMLTDPAIRAVVPPWGGETGIDLLDLLDVEAIAAADPTWCVGYSDTTTWLTPVTLRTGVATVHGQNFMDTLYRVPEGMSHWLDVASAPAGTELVQHSPGRYRTTGFDDWAADPGASDYVFDGEGTWTRIDPGHVDEPVTLRGRLVAGCVETISFIAGGAYADVNAFADAYSPEGLVHVLDIAEWGSYDICRALHAMRLHGWFDRSNGVLVSRTAAPAAPGFSQHDAVVDALGMLGVPIIADVECGHLPPYLALLNGAPTTVRFDADERSIAQTLT